MNDQERARLHDAAAHELAGIRKAEARMAAEARALERGLADLDSDIEGAERIIDVYLRDEGCGREPDHRPHWRAARPAHARAHRSRAR